VDVGVTDAAIKDLDGDILWARIAALEFEGSERGFCVRGGVTVRLNHLDRSPEKIAGYSGLLRKAMAIKVD
jgi:hypothetical protein